MLFDTHAHYDAPDFDADRDVVLSGLPDHDVALVVDPGCDIPSSRIALDLSRKYPFLFAAVGIHPENCNDYSSNDLDVLANLARSPKNVAIGEIGLDCHWDDNPPKHLQMRVFRDQMALARDLNLPVIVHDRDAHQDCLTIIREFPTVRGVFHCFAGSVEMAKELVRRGWLISFTGVLTYKNARKAVEAAAAIPLEYIMIETDSPYMAPVPHRGQRNFSGYVGLICQKLAEIKNISFHECAEATLQNGKNFFGIV